MTQPAPPNGASKLSNFFSRLNPVPSLPEYTGPYKVGTIDVEIPVSELPSPCKTPEGAKDPPIHTILFRIFYPTTPEYRGESIPWFPNPQRRHIAAYGAFLGVGPFLAEAVSFLPRHLHYASIPVHKNAPLLGPPGEGSSGGGGRWPTVVFSHGLGGSRNTYSHLAGSLASHGAVVVCPEHRDGSAVATFVRDPAAQGAFWRRDRRAEVPYRRMPHTKDPAVSEARDAQLRVRTWEVALLFEALVALDGGGGGGEGRKKKRDLGNLNASTPPACLEQLRGRLDVQDPGRVVWMGHSFGAATLVQLLKSTYYADRPEVSSRPAAAAAASAQPIFVPSPGARIRRQITERSAVVLLDMWCFPLLSPAQAPLFRLPLPCYDRGGGGPAAMLPPGGAAILAVESDAFFKWTEHLHAKALALSPDPAAGEVSAESFLLARPGDEEGADGGGGGCGRRLPGPSFFYVKESAHLNQSDLGVLFPWLTGRVFGSRDPERVLRLNVRAILQFLRTNGFAVAETSAADLVDGGRGGGDDQIHEGSDGGDCVRDDPAILNPGADSTAGAGIEGWCSIDILGLGGKSGIAVDDDNTRMGQRTEKDARLSADTSDFEDREMEMGGEIEPHLSRTGSNVVAAAVSSS